MFDELPIELDLFLNIYSEKKTKKKQGLTVKTLITPAF